MFSVPEFNSLPDLNGKVAIVTGASSGIGKAVALAFARNGAKVVLASRRVEKGEEVAHQICKQGGDAIFIRTDISKACDVEVMVNKTITYYNRLDYACNNAGIGIMKGLTDFSEEEWDCLVNSNLKGTWLCLKYELPQIQKQKEGSIVNIASINGVVGAPGMTVYSASKGGIIAMTKAVAIEYAKSGIRFNVVSPGAIQTEALNNLVEEKLSFIKAAHPIGRIGQPEEVANTVTWLCSKYATFITGQNIILDGGYTVQ